MTYRVEHNNSLAPRGFHASVVSERFGKPGRSNSLAVDDVLKRGSWSTRSRGHVQHRFAPRPLGIGEVGREICNLRRLET